MKTTVQAAIDGTSRSTPPLDDFLADYDANDNVWWMLPSGDHQNLFDAAVDRWHDEQQAHASAGGITDSQAIFFASTAKKIIEMMLDQRSIDDPQGAMDTGRLILNILTNSGWLVRPPLDDDDDESEAGI